MKNSVIFVVKMKLYRSIASVAFALLVLVSSSNFLVGIHLCGGHVQDVALFSQAEKCEMEKQTPPCHQHSANPCCQDETVVHTAQDFRSDFSPVTLATLSWIDIVEPIVLMAEVIPSVEVSRSQFYNYDPPLRPSDLTVELHVFLI